MAGKSAGEMRQVTMDPVSHLSKSWESSLQIEATQEDSWTPLVSDGMGLLTIPEDQQVWGNII
jgi:hypothetical protein